MIISTIQLIIVFSLGYLFGEAVYNYIKGTPYPREDTVVSLICLYKLLWLISLVISFYN